MTTSEQPGSALVIGLGVAGDAAARRLAEHGWSVAVVEDQPVARTRARSQTLRHRGTPTYDRPSPAALEDLVARCDVVVPSPPVPPTHAALVAARRRGIPIWSEFELAARWSSLPLVAVTGTNGKTTVTTLVEAMLAASGLRTVAAGNNDLPLVDALGNESELDVVVVEASSFRLCFTERFRPAVATWLNLAEDHLDWHLDLDHYIAAKARVWAAQGAEDVAVVNAEDPVVSAAAEGVASKLVTFGHDRGDWRVVGQDLVMPGGEVLVGVDHLWRALPHDLTNALAAAATASAAGATLEGIRATLADFRGLAHRVSLVGQADGVGYYDDSKATDPHAAASALAGFASVVLIAGGRNKGLDLAPLAEAADRLRAVVAIGEAAEEVVATFAGTAVAVQMAASMDDAVIAAGAAARPGDAVLLSPACASFDWYSSYAERGDDFARAVIDCIGVSP